MYSKLFQTSTSDLSLGLLGVEQINMSSTYMHKTSQVSTLNKYIGGQVRPKLTLFFL